MKRDFKRLAILSSFFVLAHAVNAQTDKQKDDAAFLDSFIQSKGYGSTITFSASNIKQFWVEKNVISQNNSIIIFPKGAKETSTYRIQLVNVNEIQDCKVDIISKMPDLRFSILDNSLKRISDSSSEDKFLNYSIESASFHLENTTNSSFYLRFSTEGIRELTIDKIILSFSPNKETSFLVSPGKLVITDSNCTSSNPINAEGENSFSVTGKSSQVKANKKILVSDNTFSSSVSVKNTGKVPARVHIGYELYAKDGNRITRRCNPFNNNKVLKVVSAEKGSSSIIVDSEPEWVKGCRLAINAKEDLSDFPNCSFADGSIEDVKVIDDNHIEIALTVPQKKVIPVGTLVRVQESQGSTSIHTKSVTLQPGEEAKLSSTIKKDENCLYHNNKVLCRGTYYAVPVILSSSIDSNEENSVLVSDYTIAY